MVHSTRKVFLYVFTVIILLAVILVLYNYRAGIGRVLTPFIMAVIIAYLITPLVCRLQRKRIPRTAAILLVYLFFTLLIASFLFFVVPELVNNIRELLNTLPGIVTRYQELFNDFLFTIQSSKWSSDIKDMLFEEINNSAAAAQSFVTDALKRSLTVFVQAATMFFDLVLAMVIAFYLIKDADFFKSSVLSLVPRRWRNGITGTGKEINLILSNFIQGQLMLALIVGILETIGLLIVRVRYPLVLGLVGGIANIIPYFGPIIGAVPSIAVALLESPMKAVWTALVFIIVQQLDNTFISPKIIEGRLGLHPVTTILAVLVGGEFFGIAGMLFAVPAAAILKIIIKRSIEAIV
jgi:predicted PurR-regulated permease PerM